MASINHYKTKINTYKNQWMIVGSIRYQILNITTKWVLFDLLLQNTLTK